MGTVTRELPNYILIANRIEKQIRKGEIQVGVKLNSIRHLAATEGVSVNTVRSAMDVLSQTGLIISKPRIGLIVAENNETQNFEAFEYFKPDNRLANHSRQWINAVFSSNGKTGSFVNMVLPTDTPIFKSFQRCYRQSLIQEPKHTSEHSLGDLRLRNIISDQLSARQYNVKPSHIQITNGCQNAIEHALRIVSQPGDAIAIPTPAYPGYLALLSILKLKAIEIPMTPSGPDPDILKQVMQAGEIKALIINPTSHNPTGISMSEEYKRSVALMANEHQIAVIEDDICANLSYFDAHPRPIASYDKQGWVLLVSSISKIIGDTERLGWCCPGRFKDAYKTQFAVSQITSSYYVQIALVRYLGGSRYTSQLREWRKMCKDAIDDASLLLADKLGRTISITQPSGGYALWIRLPDAINANDLLEQAKKQGIDFLPGNFFSLDEHFKNYLRLVIIPPLTQKHKEELSKLAALIKSDLKPAL